MQENYGILPLFSQSGDILFHAFGLSWLEHVHNLNINKKHLYLTGVFTRVNLSYSAPKPVAAPTQMIASIKNTKAPTTIRLPRLLIFLVANS